jgi:hypothetical protein
MTRDKSAPDDFLHATRWVHVFEEDTPDGAVYRPESGGVPLSRRPREQLELRSDGRATLFVPGPDDRLVARPAVWRDGDEGNEPRGGGTEVRIVDRSPQRLVVRFRGGGTSSR